MAKSKVVRTLDADDRRFDATGAFCILSATPCSRRRGDADHRATSGTIREAQQAPDGGSDVRGIDGGGDGREARRV